MVVIGAGHVDRRICDRPAPMLRAHRRRRQGPEASSTTITGPAVRSSLRSRTQESRSMIRQTELQATEGELEERSMRFVEYAVAFIAVLAAGILAFIR
jgi:hypothetical protein